VTRDGRPVVWEACHTFSGSWGYYRDERSWKSADLVVRMLIDTVSKGGNFLLNVGPTARGTWDPRAIERMAAIGEWMRRHGRAIHGAGAAPAGVIAPSGTRFTFNPETRRLYVHLFDWPFRHLHLPGLAGRVTYAQFLHDASELPIQHFRPASGDTPGLYRPHPDPDTLTLALPVERPPVLVPVIECWLEDA
jgi:alpha-L-fucosidase